MFCFLLNVTGNQWRVSSVFERLQGPLWGAQEEGAREEDGMCLGFKFGVRSGDDGVLEMQRERHI